MKYPVLFTVTQGDSEVYSVVFCEDKKSFSATLLTPNGIRRYTNDDFRENPFRSEMHARNALGLTPNIADAMSSDSPEKVMEFKEGATEEEYQDFLMKLESHAEKQLNSRMDSLIKKISDKK